MPIWLRRFTFNKIRTFYEEQNNKSSNEAENSWLSGEAREQAAKNKIKTSPVSPINTKRASNS